MMYEDFVVLLDLHFGKKCNIRLDDTDDVLIDKLEQVLDYCNQNDVFDIIIAGDIFDSCSISRKSFVKAIKIFKKFKDSYINVNVIYGNHDEYRYNEKFREETPLNDLIELGLVNKLNTICFKKYNIYGFDYLEIDKLKNFKCKKVSNKKNIIIAHTFYDNEFMGGEHNLTKETVDNINADYIILGHDHSYYESCDNGKTEILRFGSLVRGTSSMNDLERIPKFLHFTSNGYMEMNLKCEKLKNITVAKATIKEEKIDYKEMIEEICINDDEENTDTVMEAVNKLENEKVKEIIRRNL